MATQLPVTINELPPAEVLSGDEVLEAIQNGVSVKVRAADLTATGLSAYEVAVADGYTGTRIQWVASLKGDKGEKGDKGSTGATGIQGTQGIQGPKGDTGAKGDKGNQGGVGSQGVQGVQGVQGLKGDKGDRGDQGRHPDYARSRRTAGRRQARGGFDHRHCGAGAPRRRGH